MIAKVLAQHGDYGPAHAETTKALEVLLKSRQADGGIYNPSEGSESYTSAVALMGLAAAHRPQDASATKDLIAYLKGLQVPPGASSSDSNVEDPSGGGVSYGKRGGHPDLSNVGMWMQALHEGGVEANDPAMQRAAAFVTRLQNHSETNTQAWARKADSDGGFVYVIPGGGGRGPQEPRSYGSMTYTGFKSLLYAGVDRKDPRVQAALRWIQKYWRLDSNPNMPESQSQAGLFYYYHVFAKAMAAWGEPVITDAKGVKHNWRHELIDQLAGAVKEDGSWVNTADRWQESSPILTTVFAILAMEEAVRGHEGPASAPAAK
jgi:squalene-hopene/tetraprenyl-beta-curcumene cyclase